MAPTPTRRLPPRGARAANLRKDAGNVRRSSRNRQTAALRASNGSDEDIDELSSQAAAPGSPSGPESSYGNSRRISHSKRKRARHDYGYYDEESEDSSESEDDLSDLSSTGERVVKTETRVRRAPSRAKDLQTRTTKAVKSSQPGAKAVQEATASFSNLRTTVTPPWTTLPYLILVRVFDHAAHPLDNVLTVRWLVQASRTCRAFAEPALTALYACPPLLTMPMAHNLVALLSRPPSETAFAYRLKVRRLEIDVGRIATLSYKGRVLDLKALVESAPNITDIDLSHYKDMQPYRRLDENLKWHYPAGLFEALGLSAAPGSEAGFSMSTSNIRLRSWRWSSRMMDAHLLHNLKGLHETTAFSSLKKISFVNFQLPSLTHMKHDDAEVILKDRQYVQHLADAICALPSLTSIVLESSTLVNDIFLPLLPRTIQNLDLINCWEVKAEDFADYLVTHGHELRSLSLRHNQSLSLEFLPILGTACPKLRSLWMDLTYYNHHEFYSDSGPMYDALLLPGQRPTWPSTLKSLGLEHLRKWGPEAAEMLFQSLVDAAPHLPNLRYLSIKAMLDIPWRQRSQMRNRWPSTLKRVFARPWSEPEKSYTLRPPAVDAEPDHSAKKRKRILPVTTSPVRHSHRLAAQVAGPSPGANSAIRGQREGKEARLSYVDRSTDDDDAQDNEELDMAEEGSGTEQHGLAANGRRFVQGLCEVVDIRIDNQKPTELQWGMDDFLDSEDASDEDWNGD